MMKGITNSQLREKLENIEVEIKELKQFKQVRVVPSHISIWLGVFTVFSIISTIMMVLDSHPLFFYFTIIGISEMMFLIFYLIFKRNKK